METIDPEILAQNPTRLNEQQLQMLQIFKNPLPKEEYEEIKRHILKIKAKSLDNAIEEWEGVTNIAAETYEQWGKEHMRTPYKRLP